MKLFRFYRYGCTLILVALVAFTVGAFAVGCGPARNFKTAVIDCTLADNAAKIAIVEAELKKLTSWSERGSHAVAFGVVIGGCALLRLVDRETPKTAASVLPSTDEGTRTFERFRREVAGGAQFLTADGPR